MDVDIKVFPNPATSTIIIDATVKVNVSIISMDGQLISRTADASNIDVSGLSNGMYMIMIYDENNVLLKADKFIKVN